MSDLIKLTKMSDREIQDWLRKVSMETDKDVLPVALSGVDDEIKECVFRNMSVPAKTAIQNSIQEQSRNILEDSKIRKNINIIADLL